MSQQWSPTSWREKKATQQPSYPCQEAVDSAVQQLAKLPPLVTSWEIESLKSQLAEAAADLGTCAVVGSRTRSEGRDVYARDSRCAPLALSDSARFE